MKLKKVLKIIGGVIIFLTLPSLLFFGFMYFKYNEELPIGSNPDQANVLAQNMLDALNHKAFDSTNYIEWTFKNRHHYKWKKNKKTCMVYWKDYKVDLDLNNYAKSKVYVHSFKIEGDNAKELVDKAIGYFNNDSFWLIAPYKIFDEGTNRSIVKLDNGQDGLLVTYTSGGSTPGDSYLWHLDANGKPTSFQIWADILPIDGLEASWTDWTITESGANLPTFHKLSLLGIEISDIKGEK